jgi:U3 small nucleolar ribonucleoprotein protein IMP4
MLLTTSRRPTGRIRTFCRDLANSIPDVVRVNRGKMSLDGVAEKAIELEADRVVVVDRWHGGPGKINLFQISSTGLKPVPPLMLIRKILLRREFKEGTRRARSSAITVEPQDSAELTRIAGQLSQYFGLPVLSLDEASENHRASMHFSFDSSRHIQSTFMLLSRMVEIGPRVTLSKLIWEVPS